MFWLWRIQMDLEECYYPKMKDMRRLGSFHCSDVQYFNPTLQGILQEQSLTFCILTKDLKVVLDRPTMFSWKSTLNNFWSNPTYSQLILNFNFIFLSIFLMTVRFKFHPFIYLNLIAFGKAQLLFVQLCKVTAQIRAIKIDSNYGNKSLIFHL